MTDKRNREFDRVAQPGNLAESPSSAARLLDREAPEDARREATAHVAAERTVVEPGTKPVMVFRISTEWFALPVSVIQEICPHVTVRKLPHRRGGILNGLVNVRGELLLCVALGAVLGIEETAGEGLTLKSASSDRLMICRSSDAQRLAFQVNQVHALHRYHPKDLRKTPATLAKSAAGVFALGVLPWNKQTVGCLDAELLFYTLNKGLT